MKIYTKLGDKGETGLINGKKVSKSDLRIDAYGTIDELNAVLGVVISIIQITEVKELLRDIQNKLFSVGSDLAAPISEENKKYEYLRIDNSFVETAEREIDRYEEKLEKLSNFILPGGTQGAAYLHLARTVCRRAERQVVSLIKNVEINPIILVYLNRLSDLFFVLARYENSVNNIPDVIWKKD
jgi:cob(I)alamin adenosyltransferase